MDKPIKSKHVTAIIVLSVLSICLSLFIIIESFVPGSESAAQSDWLTKLIASILHIEPTSDLALFLRKACGHFGLFFINGILVTITLAVINTNDNEDIKLSRTWLFLASLAFGFLLACISELIQVFIPGRVGAWTDIGIDSLGYIVGEFLLLLIQVIIAAGRKHQISKTQKN